MKPVRFRGQLLRIGTMWTDKLEGGHEKSIFLSRFISSITVTRDWSVLPATIYSVCQVVVPILTLSISTFQPNSQIAECAV